MKITKENIENNYFLSVATSLITCVNNRYDSDYSLYAHIKRKKRYAGVYILGGFLEICSF